MKHTLTILIALIFLAACTSAPTAVPTAAPTATALPSATTTITATPTNTPTPTATPRPQPRVIVDNAVLYAGPGNVGYSTLAQLASGTQVVPIGAFGEFIKVQVSASGRPQEGFVLGKSLENVPANLPQLNQDQVAWAEMPNTWSTWIGKSGLKHDNIAAVYGGYWTQYDDSCSVSIPDPLVVEVQFKGQGQEYGILLYGRVNKGEGEWWSGIRRLDVREFNGRLDLLFRDGTRAGGTTFNVPQSLKGERITLRFDENGSIITIVGQDGKPLTQNPIRLAVPLFPDKVLYVGLNAAPKALLEVTGFSVRVPPSGKYTTLPTTVSVTQLPTLRELAKKRGIQIGAMLGLQKPCAANVFTREYDRLVSEDFHWRLIRPSREGYDFSKTDLQIEFASRNGIPVEAHHLVWGAPEHLPDWLKNGNFTREELLKILHDHINTVVTHYKGKVSAWSIANEVTSRTVWGKTDGDFWYKNIGPDYVEMAFRWAREADPNATLMLNDNNNEGRHTPNNARITDAMYDLVKQLKQKGVPVDSVGMQMHLLSPFASDKRNPPNKEDVTANMRRFAGLGVNIYVTEFDVNITEIPGTQPEKWAFQAKVYGDMLQACVESQVCKGFSIFGIRDGDSWYYPHLGLPNADPLPLDKNYNPKPAYFAMRDILAGK